MTITAETDVSELLKPLEALGIVNKYSSTIISNIEKRIHTIEEEMNKGLSPDACEVLGLTKLNENSRDVLQSYKKVSKEFEQLKKEVLRVSKEQRKKELIELRNALTRRISGLSKALEEIQRAASSSGTNAQHYYETYQNTLTSKQKYEKDLERVNALISAEEQ